MSPLTTSRTLTDAWRRPAGGGMRGSTSAHSSSVTSLIAHILRGRASAVFVAPHPATSQAIRAAFFNHTRLNELLTCRTGS